MPTHPSTTTTPTHEQIHAHIHTAYPIISLVLARIKARYNISVSGASQEPRLHLKDSQVADRSRGRESHTRLKE